MSERNTRTEMLIGEAAVKKLAECRVAVFGIGGVGSYTVEALARTGVGSLLLIDGDTVSESNINRQLIADCTTVGRDKTEVARERILKINPECRVEAVKLFATPENITSLGLCDCDYIVDAIDTVTTKLALAELSHKISVPIISCMGTGNKLDPTAFEVTDIYKTSVCPLARVMRAELRKRGVPSLKVVYSREEPRRAVKDSSLPPASISFVPSAAGLIIASTVVKDIINGDLQRA